MAALLRLDIVFDLLPHTKKENDEQRDNPTVKKHPGQLRKDVIGVLLRDAP